jgi:hypothetical protein
MRNRDGELEEARDILKVWRELRGRKPTEPAKQARTSDMNIEAMLDSDRHQRRPSNDAEIIDQAAKVRKLTWREVLPV